MIDRHACPQKSNVARRERTIEEARNYEDTRFDSSRRVRSLDEFEKTFAQRVLRMVGTDSHIVDIPCGSGRFFPIFSEAGRLTMVDRSPSMLQAAREKVGGTEDVDLIQAEIPSLPLTDNAADLCFCMRLFHHFKNDDNRLDALKELARVTRKYVALSFYNQNCLRFYRKRILRKRIRGNYISFGHLADLARQAGLEVVERFPKLNLIDQQCLVILKKS